MKLQKAVLQMEQNVRISMALHTNRSQLVHLISHKHGSCTLRLKLFDVIYIELDYKMTNRVLVQSLHRL